MTPRISLFLVVSAGLALTACDSKSDKGTGSSPSAGAPAAPAAAPAAAGGSARKLKTKLTSKQIEDTWAGMKGNFEFKKHSEMATAKLGPAQSTNGDQSCWYGYKAASGAEPDDCMQLCTSATKGSGTQTTDGSGKCWE